MKIILINHYSGSEIHGMEYRPFFLAREWVKLGHQVTIVAASFSHLHSKKPALNGYLKEEIIEGIRYIWLKTPRYEGNGFMRVLNMLTFSLMLYLNKSSILRDSKPDFVIASSPHPFIIYGAFSIARSSNAKVAFEVRDLWPLTLIELGNISCMHPLIFLMQLTENFAYRRSDRIVSLLPKAERYMEEHGMEPSKFVYIPNGVNVEEWRKSKNPLPLQHSEILNRLRQKGHFIVGYAGAHGIANALHNLIEAFVSLKDKTVSLVLVGQGPEKKSLQQKAFQLGLDNIFFLPPVSRDVVPSLLSSMDVLYIGLRKEPLFSFGISPNKLLDYMMSSKPIIHAIDAGNDLVAESGCGISISPESPEAIAKTVIKLMNMTSAERKEMGLRGKKYILAYHDYTILAKRFLEVLS